MRNCQRVARNKWSLSPIRRVILIATMMATLPFPVIALEWNLQALTRLGLDGLVQPHVQTIIAEQDNLKKTELIGKLVDAALNKDELVGQRIAPQVLASLPEPWNLGERSDAIAQLYQEILRLDDAIESNARDNIAWNVGPTSKFAIRNALDDALANASGMFKEAVAFPFACKNQENCADAINANISRKIAIFSDLREKFPASNYAPRAVVLRGDARIISVTAQLGNGRDELNKVVDEYDAFICAADCPDRPALKSPDGWRWLSDAAYGRAVTLILLGDFEKAEKAAEALKNWPAVLDGSRQAGKAPYYVGLRKSVVSSIAQANPGYVDQTYIYQVVPGAATPLKRFFSTRELGAQLVELMPKMKAEFVQSVDTALNEEDPGLDYFRYVDAVAKLLSTIQRRDNIVVLSSLRDGNNAERETARLSKLLDPEFGKAKSAKLKSAKVTRRLLSSGWHQIKISRALSDSEVAEVLTILKSKQIEGAFISRPRVL